MFLNYLKKFNNSRSHNKHIIIISNNVCTTCLVLTIAMQLQYYYYIITVLYFNKSIRHVLCKPEVLKLIFSHPRMCIAKQPCT